ncbi:hypothetical protein ACRE_026470 [Hapsidospora chrysogenum ATCC 11550]|uniref:Peptidase S1 domain-containing protein n=1 Tax=Hapsidospora chrysogenum (strain ATCC 11550 / CBS 779.69 / DSM 880 / IAM 14645 / JCM 23072 / IMI 49137) TaxID=857340 RepID=A0A086TAZ6_HAPC1|nr:hypothetical protein ACRE_026470 [Hapsidospora chrysogenum ATCC 11550]
MAPKHVIAAVGLGMQAVLSKEAGLTVQGIWEGSQSITDRWETKHVYMSSIVSLPTPSRGYICGGTLINAYIVAISVHCAVARSTRESKSEQEAPVGILMAYKSK